MYVNNVFRRIGLPGPIPIPFLGEMLNVMFKGVYKNDTELVNKYGKVIGVYEGTAHSILVSDLDLLRNVLIRDSNIFINRRTIDHVSGPLDYGLTVLKDEQWKNARSIVSPTFSTAKLKGMYSLMNDISDIFNKQLLVYADQQETFDIKSLNEKYTLDNIASCLFGVETNSLENQNTTLISHLKAIFRIGFANLFILILLISPRLAMYLGKKGFSVLPRSSVNYLTNTINQILNQRRQHLERRNDFIQMMVDHEKEVDNNQQEDKQQLGSLKKTLNDKEIVGQALVFMLAGYETTSVLLTFFFYVMATEPEIQEKVYEEIRQTVGDDEITYEKLGELQYLDMVINETLRMYPPFLRFDRIASQDYQLGDYLIPKGSFVNVPVYPIHHDSNYWPEPEKFIPERFSSEEKAKRHPMAYLPFGDGPRNCIGMRFALLEAKLGIAKAIRLVEFQISEKTQIPIQFGNLAILTSKKPIVLRVTRRSY